MAKQPAPEVVTMSPGLLTSITIELDADNGDEIHVHPAGQGFWVARMLAALGARAVLCCPCGGEAVAMVTGAPLDDIELHQIPVPTSTGAYVDDRRGGSRERLATMPAPSLDRHAIDDLVGSVVADGINAGTVVLTGSNGHHSVPASIYTTLGTTLHELGVSVFADLSGTELLALLDGHVDVLKLSHSELIDAGFAKSDDERSLRDGALSLARTSGADVFVTRAGAGALACTSDGYFVGSGPQVDVVEHRGAGDSFTAAVTVARLVGLEVAEQLRMAMAAAATNVLRHGLGSATLDAVHAIGTRIEVTAA